MVIDSQTDETTEDIVGATRRFAEASIAPRVEEMDRTGRLDPDVREELFASGLMSLVVPQAYVGRERSFLQVSRVIEEIARVCPGVALVVDVHNVLVSAVILRHGNGDQRRRFLPILSRSALGAFAISEDRAGSDAFAIQMQAKSDGRDYRLTGRKCWTSSAEAADLFVTFARTSNTHERGLSAFVIERESEGLSVDRRAEQIGVRAAATADLVLDHVPVPRASLLGRPGGGEIVALDAFAIGRVGIAAQLVGLAQGALDTATSYACEREQFGHKIAAFQGVRFPLAAIAAELEAARALTYRAARVVDADSSSAEQLRVSAMAKYIASQVATRAAASAVDACGGRGVIRGSMAEKLFRDARAGAIYEGTANLILRSIATTLFTNRDRADEH
jgi:short-chain 2-methylacyl-CoA dehydrogenase